MNNWVPAFNAGDIHAIDWHPIQGGGVEILLVASSETGDKRRLGDWANWLVSRLYTLPLYIS